jgi:hypothetical protein
MYKRILVPLDGSELSEHYWITRHYRIICREES